MLVNMGEQCWKCSQSACGYLNIYAVALFRPEALDQSLVWVYIYSGPGYTHKGIWISVFSLLSIQNESVSARDSFVWTDSGIEPGRRIKPGSQLPCCHRDHGYSAPVMLNQRHGKKTSHCPFNTDRLLLGLIRNTSAFLNGTKLINIKVIYSYFDCFLLWDKEGSASFRMRRGWINTGLFHQMWSMSNVSNVSSVGFWNTSLESHHKSWALTRSYHSGRVLTPGLNKATFRVRHFNSCYEHFATFFVLTKSIDKLVSACIVSSHLLFFNIHS